MELKFLKCEGNLLCQQTIYRKQVWNGKYGCWNSCLKNITKCSSADCKLPPTIHVFHTWHEHLRKYISDKPVQMCPSCLRLESSSFSVFHQPEPLTLQKSWQLCLQAWVSSYLCSLKLNDPKQTKKKTELAFLPLFAPEKTNYWCDLSSYYYMTFGWPVNLAYWH